MALRDVAAAVAEFEREAEGKSQVVRRLERENGKLGCENGRLRGAAGDKADALKRAEALIAVLKKEVKLLATLKISIT